jgi:hypothetical protein
VTDFGEERFRLKKHAIVLLLISSTLASAVAHAASPIIPAVETADIPVIDGDLSDPCWQKAPQIQEFYFLPNGSPASESTTARLCYDRKNVYVAFYCKDSQPDKIVAEQKKRGGVIDTDDWVGFDLDTYCTFQHAKMSSVQVSARGVQVEQFQSGDVSNIEWKGDWRAVTKRTADGYTVEIAIPFSILQYDASATRMGVAFMRGHARMKQTWWAPNLGPGEDPKNYYMWEGLDLPKPSTRPLLLGYTLIGTGEDSPRQAGMDMKYAITPSLTSVLTVHPDFRNVEQEVENIDFTYTTKYRDDSRPFFQEGSMYFPGKDMFWSYPIGDIGYGAKISGRYDQLQIAALSCGSAGGEDYSMVHIGREWPAKGNLRLIGVLSDKPGVHNLATGITGGYRVYDHNDVKLHFAAKMLSADAADGTGRGHSTDFSLYDSGKPRVLAWQIDRISIDPNFDPFLGYVPDKGIEGWEGWMSLHDEMSQGKLTQWKWNVNLDMLDRMDGSPYNNTLSTNYTLDWRSGHSIRFSASASDRKPSALEIDPLYLDRTVGVSYLWGTQNLYDRGGFGIDIGRVAGGRYQSYGLGQSWQASENLSLSLDYYYSSIDPPSPEAYSANQVVGQLTYDIDNERTLAGRAVAQAGGTNVYLAYKQRVRSGMDVYVIYGTPNSTTTQNTFLLKLLRPF